MNLDDVTILIKSFLRKDSLDNLIQSIRKRYQSVKIVVVDDSSQNYNFGYDPNITTYNLPFDSGVCVGRMYGIDRITTPYFVLCDDDFEFTNETNLETFLEVARTSDLDILGGIVIDKGKPLMYYGNFIHMPEDNTLECRAGYEDHGLWKTCECIPQFYIAKTKKIRKHRYNDELKTAEHTAFFYEHRKNLTVGYTDKVSIVHQQTRDDTYSEFRNRGYDIFQNWMKKHSLTKFINVVGHVTQRFDPDIALENLCLLSKIFKENSVPYWLTDGTLLGYIREKNFIKHDMDTDIGLYFKDFSPAVLNKILDAGFKIYHTFGYPEDSFEIALTRGGIKTDLFFFYERKDGKVYHSAFLRNQRIDYSYTKFSLREIVFLGHKFSAPDNIPRYVITKYGTSWATPVVKWDWAYGPANHEKTNIVIDPELQKQKFNQWFGTKRKSGIVITYGTFDTLHYGHLELFRRAKDLGQKLIVAVSTDEFNAIKGKTSKFKYDQRVEWLRGIRWIDEIIPETSWDQKSKDIETYDVEKLVMGDDWAGKFDNLSCEVVYLPRTPEISSSLIKKNFKMKAFVISLSKINESITTAQQMIEPLTDMGFDVELFEGTYGDEAMNLARAEGRTLHPIDQEGNPTPDTIRTRGPGALGCFYSHYRLWQKCVELNEPIWIFEDDVQFIRPYQPVEFDDVLITVIGSWKRMYERDVYVDPDGPPRAESYLAPCVPGTPGYAIKPHAAARLLEEFKNTFTASDCAIRSSLVNIKIHSHIIGVPLTDKDGKKSLTNSSYWDRPRAFVITLIDHRPSVESAKKVLTKLTEYNFRAEAFRATDGKEAQKLFKQQKRRVAELGIKTDIIPVSKYKEQFPNEQVPSSAIGIEVRRPFKDDPRYEKATSPGVLGCFYSHYRLWQKCVELNEPIWIFEDDVIFERKYTPVEFDEILLLCVGKKAFTHDFYSPLLYEPSGEPCALPVPNLSFPGAVGYAIKPSAAKKLVETYSQEMLPADTALNRHVLNLQCHNYLMGRAAIADDGKISMTDPGGATQ